MVKAAKWDPGNCELANNPGYSMFIDFERPANTLLADENIATIVSMSMNSTCKGLVKLAPLSQGREKT